MINSELFSALEALESETGISKSYMLEKIEVAIQTAYRRDFPQTEVKIFIDEHKKEMRIYELREVVEEVEDPKTQITLDDAKKISSRYVIGSMAELEIKPKNFGRIAAQTAKQVIIQSIREAERGMLIKEYENKKEELISATVYKVEPSNGNAILDIGKGEAVLTKQEQIPGEVIKEGNRIKVFVIEVKNQSKGPLITLSRKHPGFVKRLFEIEVPEISDGTVMIHSISREAGSRTKMAVSSTNPDVDPIGSCIGARGTRINTITQELGGEKIDIIKYSDDPVEYIKAALSPANVISVSVSSDRTCRVLVENNQLSLAIGKEGQNARLAAKMTGFKIDIKTPQTI